MSETATTAVTNDKESQVMPKKKNLWLILVIVAVIAGGIFAFAYHHLGNEKANLENALLQRQGVMLNSRAESADTTLKAGEVITSRLVNSDIFQLFASEVDKRPNGVPLLFSAAQGSQESDDSAEQLSSQLPLMNKILTDFVSDNGYIAGVIANSKGEPYLSSLSTMEPLSEKMQEFVKKVVESGGTVYAPLEISPSGAILLTTYKPIMPPAHDREKNRPVAVLVLTRQIGNELASVLSPGLFKEAGQTLRLVQKNGDLYQNVNVENRSILLANGFAVDAQNHLPFGIRESVANKMTVYSSAFKVQSVDWWIVAENDADAINAEMATKAQYAYILAGLVSLVLVLVVIAIWWRFIGQQQGAINEKFRNLLSVIDEQKQMLDGINSTIADPISLTDTSGRFVYVNAAFAKAVGREEKDITGLDGQAVFGFDTSKRLAIPDQHVLLTGESVSISEVLWLQSKRYYFQISKSPLLDSSSRVPQGIVSVYRDITQLVESEQHSRRVVQQTINALVRTIEEADPFLGGHSRIMGGIAGLMAKQLNLSRNDIATIEAAANLSQIGKMFVPREILLKPGVLTPEEKKEMEKHVEHACNVLKDIEFDLPVIDAIRQMNERLDGHGYPEGLHGDQISMHARVIAVANAFAAMARPRSYRPALPIEKVLTILSNETGSYDPAVVDALRQVLATPAGERVVEQAAASKAI